VRVKNLSLGAFTILTCSLFGASTQKNDMGMEFVKIPAGEFMMGCSEGDDNCKADEKPAHKVHITKPFEMAKYEVTQVQWRAVMGSNPSTMKGDNRPVETVTKEEANDFLNKLNARNDGYKYRLPTEAEWEYAARAGTQGPYTGKLDDIAWYAGNSEDETHPVGLKKPNAWGLYDMQGNVREWVSDAYNANYYSNSPAADPTGPQPGQGGRGGLRGGRGGRGPRGFGAPPPPPPGPEALQGAPRGQRGEPRGGARGGPGGGLPIMRGGGWDNLETFLRVSDRYHYYGPTLRVSDVGFRAVREPIAQ
jgi:formylglycine-generating enzyme required for sulfatase activity